MDIGPYAPPKAPPKARLTVCITCMGASRATPTGATDHDDHLLTGDVKEFVEDLADKAEELVDKVADAAHKD